ASCSRCWCSCSRVGPTGRSVCGAGDGRRRTTGSGSAARCGRTHVPRSKHCSATEPTRNLHNPGGRMGAAAQENRRARRPMPNLRHFERHLGDFVEGLFSKTFRSGLQPVEIAKRIVREMDDGKQVGVDEVWAPNRFEASLSNDDAPRFSQMEAALATEL